MEKITWDLLSKDYKKILEFSFAMNEIMFDRFMNKTIQLSVILLLIL